MVGEQRNLGLIVQASGISWGGPKDCAPDKAYEKPKVDAFFARIEGVQVAFHGILSAVERMRGAAICTRILASAL